MIGRIRVWVRHELLLVAIALLVEYQHSALVPSFP